MSIVIDWFDKEYNIILINYIGGWKIDDITSQEADLRTLSSQANGRFDIISDLTKTQYTLPIGSLFTWVNNAEARSKEYPQWGLSVFVGKSSVHRAYYQAGIDESEIIQKHCRMVETLEQAVRLILDDRQSNKS